MTNKKTIFLLTRELGDLQINNWPSMPKVVVLQLEDLTIGFNKAYQRMCGFAPYSRADTPAEMRKLAKVIEEDFSTIKRLVQALDTFLPELVKQAEVGANEVELAKVTRDLEELAAQKERLDQRQFELAKQAIIDD